MWPTVNDVRQRVQPVMMLTSEAAAAALEQRAGQKRSERLAMKCSYDVELLFGYSEPKHLSTFVGCG